ncbi:MAG: adk, adenylate kinase, adenylate kinase [Parcubacteria group bacterium]|nr:adk, adenylate kinase, adenylate kinase [Parcubacteria group bacterium]
MERKTIIFFGQPGAGKSTQIEILKKEFERHPARRVFSFAWSQARDEFMHGYSAAHKRLQEYHARGQLQPKFFSIAVWGSVFLRELQGDEHLVIDGIPRQAFEAEALESFFEFMERTDILICNLVLPQEIARTRLLARARTEGRVDDTEESIDRRLAWYETDTELTLTALRANARYRVIDIDATKSIDEIGRAIQNLVR